MELQTERLFGALEGTAEFLSVMPGHCYTLRMGGHCGYVSSNATVRACGGGTPPGKGSGSGGGGDVKPGGGTGSDESNSLQSGSEGLVLGLSIGGEVKVNVTAPVFYAYPVGCLLLAAGYVYIRSRKSPFARRKINYQGENESYANLEV